MSGPIDTYVAGFSGDARSVLEQLRDLLREALPGATETIAYGVPTFDLHGQHVLHFGGFKTHAGLYPTPSGTTAFDAELAPYRHGKRSVRLPYDEPLPVDLVRRIAAYRLAEVGAAPAKKRTRSGSRSGASGAPSKATGKQHAHKAVPTDDDLREVVKRLQPQQETLYIATHALVVDALPDVRFEVDLVDGSIGYGVRQFGYGGWGMASLSAHKGWVSLFLMKGVEVPDPDGVLEGSGKLLRHVKLRSVEALEVRGPSLRAFLDAASRLHVD